MGIEYMHSVNYLYETDALQHIIQIRKRVGKKVTVDH